MAVNKLTADSSSARVLYIEETEWGVTPDTGNVSTARITSESLVTEIPKVESEEIRADRQRLGSIPTEYNPGGTINGEFSFGTYDAFIAAALSKESTWTNRVFNLAVNAVSVVDGNLVLDDMTGFPFAVGDAIKMVSPTATVNSYEGFIVGINTDTKTVSLAPKLVGVAGDPEIELSGATVSNGSDLISFSIEKSFTDTGSFFIFRGMLCNTFTVSVSATAVTTVAFEFLGRGSSLGTTTNLPTTISPSTTTMVLSGVNSDNKVVVDGEQYGYIETIELTINNNITRKNVIGILETADLGQGSFQVSGSFSAYFEDGSRDLYDKFINNQSVQLGVILGSRADGMYAFLLPSLDITTCNIESGSIDEAVKLNVEFSGKISDTGSTMHISKLNND